MRQGELQVFLGGRGGGELAEGQVTAQFALGNQVVETRGQRFLAGQQLIGAGGATQDLLDQGRQFLRSCSDLAADLVE